MEVFCNANRPIYDDQVRDQYCHGELDRRQRLAESLARSEHLDRWMSRRHDVGIPHHSSFGESYDLCCGLRG